MFPVWECDCLERECRPVRSTVSIFPPETFGLLESLSIRMNTEEINIRISNFVHFRLSKGHVRSLFFRMKVCIFLAVFKIASMYFKHSQSFCSTCFQSIVDMFVSSSALELLMFW